MIKIKKEIKNVSKFDRLISYVDIHTYIYCVYKL